MENSSKKIRIICPECMNYLNITSRNNDTYKGICPVCKALIQSKQISKKEKSIRIFKTEIN